MSILISILFLALMEGLLSFDNALALASMVKHLPEKQRRVALSYGVWGAFLFRIISIFFLSHILANPWIKVIGGCYLLFIAIKNLLFKEGDDPSRTLPVSQMWRVILMVEITDIVFSVDSILAGVAFSQTAYIVIIGGILGIIMMRFASAMFLTLMKQFPQLEITGFQLVFIVGMKLLLESITQFHLDFSNSSTMEFRGFWAAMLTTLALGFLKNKEVVSGQQH